MYQAIGELKECSCCHEIKNISEFHKHKRNPDGLRYKCKKCNNKEVKEYRKRNIEIVRKRSRDWCKNNKEKINKYVYNRLRKNSNYRISNVLRKRVGKVIKGKKSKPTMKLLGCTIEQLKKYLQQTAIKNGYLNFDINNYSGKEYHIDHIIPCNSFDLSKPEEQEKCFNYKNLQILTAKENQTKFTN